MKKILKGLILFYCFSLLFVSCESDEDGHEFITIINCSEEEIVYQEIIAGIIQPNDTLYQCSMIQRYAHKNSSTKCYAPIRSKTWEKLFKSDKLPYIQFLFVKDSIHSNVDCATISKYNMVLHRYQVTLEDLQQMNWTIIYPPSCTIDTLLNK
jgi:hypothetical protein